MGTPSDIGSPSRAASSGGSGRLLARPGSSCAAVPARVVRYRLGVDGVLSVSPRELAGQLAPFFDDLFAGVEGLRMAACCGISEAAGDMARGYRELFVSAYDRLSASLTSVGVTPATRHLAAALSDMLHGGLAKLRRSRMMAGSQVPEDDFDVVPEDLDSAAAHILQQQDLLHSLRSDRPGSMGVGRLFSDHGGVVRRLLSRAGKFETRGVAAHRLDGTSRQPELLLALLAHLNLGLEQAGSPESECVFDFAAQGWTLRLESQATVSPGAPHDVRLVAKMVDAMDGRVHYDAPSEGKWLLQAWFPYGGGELLGVSARREPAVPAFVPQEPFECAIDVDADETGQGADDEGAAR